MTTTQPSSVDPAEADRALKAKHRAIWASGDYPAVAREIVHDLGPTLVKACGVTVGQRVLDVGAGSGNASIPAALTGATVIASDLTPELFDEGRRIAAERGARLEWQQGDAESLPYGDDEFDVVLSCLGAMFAPHHQATADELVRVCRPGGTIGMINWTPAGFVGQMFTTMGPYAPPPPPGAQPPPLWGSEEHVRELFRDRVADLSMRRQTVTIDRFDEPVELREYFKANYGPTIAVYRYNSDDPQRVAALDRDLAKLTTTWSRGVGTATFHAEYLLVTARRPDRGKAS